MWVEKLSRRGHFAQTFYKEGGIPKICGWKSIVEQGFLHKHFTKKGDSAKISDVA